MPLKQVFWPALLLKLGAGLFLGWVYTSYYRYQADTMLYFEDARRLSQLAWEHPSLYLKLFFFNHSGPETADLSFGLWQQPRAFFMAKLVSIVTVFTRNSYPLTGLYMSLFSFYGFWRLANTLVLIFPSSATGSVIAFLFFPSVVFWSSGLIKETIAMTCITGSLHLMAAYSFGVYKRHPSGKKLWHSLLALLCIFIVWKLKYYYLAVLLPVCGAYPASAYLLRKFFNNPKLILQITIYLLVFGCILSGATLLHPSLNFSYLIGTIIENHDVTFAASAPEDVIHFNTLQPALPSLIENFPLAMVSGLFRPLLWEGETLFQWFTGLENVFILLLTLYAFLSVRKLTISKQPHLFLLIVSLVVYVLLLATLMAFSTPNFGTLARYKVGYMPFYMYGIAWIASLRMNLTVVNRAKN